MHLESVPCLHHMLSSLRRRLAGATLSLASRVYLQKGENWHRAAIGMQDRTPGGRVQCHPGEMPVSLGALPGQWRVTGWLTESIFRSCDFICNSSSLPGYEVKEEFLEESEKFYGAKPVTLSGSSEDDLTAINKWVKEATNGQIPTFLQQLPGDTVMLLLNAIHFHGELHRS